MIYRRSLLVLSLIAGASNVFAGYLSIKITNPPPTSSFWGNGNNPIINYAFAAVPASVDSTTYPTYAVWDHSATDDNRACTSSGKQAFNSSDLMASSTLPEGDWYVHLCIEQSSQPSNQGFNVYHFMTDNTAPSVPAGFVATATTPTEIDLAWNASTDNTGVAGYQLYRNGSVIATIGTVTSYADKNLTAGTTYTYQIQAYDDAYLPNQSALSASLIITPGSAEALSLKVHNPPAAGVWLNGSSPIVSYTFDTTPSSAPSASYPSYAAWDTDPTNDNRACSAPQYSFDPAAILYSNSLPEGNLYLHLCIKDAANPNNQGWSVTHFMTDNTPPTVPVNVQAVINGSSEIDLSWTASTDNVAVAGYQVYRGGVLVATPTTTSYADKGLSAGTTYTYTIAAFDETQPANVSALSTPVQATTAGTGGQGSLVTLQGNLEFDFGETSNSTEEVLQYALATPSQHYALVFQNMADIAGIKPGSYIQVTGYESGNVLTVSSSGQVSQGVKGQKALSQPTGGSPVKILEQAPSAAQGAQGVRKVAVVLITFNNDSTEQFDNSTVQNVVFTQANSFYQENSYGQMSIGSVNSPAGDVYGYINVPVDSVCNQVLDGTASSNLFDQAMQAAQQAGIPTANYQSIIFLGHELTTCIGGEFWGTFGGSPASVIMKVPVSYGLEEQKVTHELGHNLGLAGHARYLRCPGQTFSPSDVTYEANGINTCYSVEYGDPYDTMGMDLPQPREFNPGFKDYLGWLTAEPVTVSGNYQINTYETPSSVVKALKIGPLTNGDTFYFEYRQPIGSDAYVSTFTPYIGPMMHLGREAPNYLLDMSPTVPNTANPEEPYTPGLGTGLTYTDYANRFSLTTISTTSAGTEVQILMPTASAPAVEFLAPLDGASVSGSVPITVNALDLTAVSKVELSIDGTLAATLTAKPYTYTWNAQGVTSGAHTISAKVYNSAGNTSSQQVSVTVMPPLTIAMTAPADGTTVDVGNPVTLSASATAGSGAITQVQFLSGPNVIGTGSLSNGVYSFSWVPTTTGEFSISAVVTDNQGHSLGSNAITVAVINPQSNSPSVGILLSPARTTYVPGTTLLVTANVLSDPGGEVAGLVLSGLIYESCAGSSCSASVPLCCSGAISQSGLSEMVTAVDAAGNALASQTVAINIEGAPPVTLGSPQNLASFPADTSLTLSATAYAVGGTVESVDFYANGSKIGTSTSGSTIGTNGATLFTFQWTNVPTNAYGIVAQATGSNGLVALSNTASVDVGLVVDYNGSTAPPPPPPYGTSITVTGPPTGVTFPSGVNIPLLAQATIPSGTGITATGVTFYANGSLLGAGSAYGTGGGYFYNWNGAIPGTYSVTAVVSLSNDETLTSTAIQIVVQPAVSLSNITADMSLTSVLEAKVNVPTQQIQWVVAAPHSSIQSATFNPSVVGSASSLSIASPWWGVQSSPGIYSVMTNQPSLDLGPLALAAGPYQVSVTVQDTYGMVYPSAEATINLVGAGDFNASRVYPNPWHSDIHSGQPITFDQLPTGSTVKIFTLAGQWVKTLSAPDGMVKWDLTNDDGHKAASGIYLYLITSNGQKTRGKLGIVR